MEISSVNSVSAANQVQGSQAVNSAPEVAAVEKTTPAVSISENTGRANEGQNSQNGKSDDYTPSNEAVKKAVEVINKKLGDSRAVFGVHEDTNRVTIKMVSKDSKEVLKEYPVEETLDALAKLWDMAGVMVDEKR